MRNVIKNLQDQPYETLIKILWSSVIAIGLVILVIWVSGLKSTLSSVSGTSLVKLDTQTIPATKESQIKFATIEYVDQSASQLKIYFNFNNPTDDILNVSKLENISLSADGKTLAAQKITDRQGNAYVQKILTHTQNFGIITFPSTKAGKATLIFDQMFLEKDPSSLFQQKIELKFSELNKPTNIGN